MPLLTTMSALLARNVSDRGDAIAFSVHGGDGDREISYREFDALVQRSAAWLSQQGIGPGDLVAVWLVNRVEWMALYFGLARLGAALMAVNTRYRSHEMAYILERSQAKMLILQPNFHQIDFSTVLCDVPDSATRALQRVAMVDAGQGRPTTVLGKPTVSFHLNDLPAADVPVAVGSADDLTHAEAASVLFSTSGTTSGPKLVVHTQRNVTLHAQRTARAYGFEEEGVRLLAALPFCGVFGFNAAMAAFAAGKPFLVMETFDAQRARQLINRHRITHVFGSDDMFSLMIGQCDWPQPFPSARVFGCASFHPGILDYAQVARQGGMPLLGLYGSSEVQALFALQRCDLPLEERIKAGGVPASIGAGAQVRIRDIDSGALLPAGHSGAIEIRADTNFTGYLNNPEATARAIDAEGFFRTGDVGYLRADGSFVYETRQGDAMRLAGYLVSPVEIEDVLKSVPGVTDVQVVAVDIGAQMKPVAFVIGAPALQGRQQDMLDAVAAVLAPYKVPARLWLVDAFPITQSANGTKIQRVKLREMALQRLAQNA